MFVLLYRWETSTVQYHVFSGEALLSAFSMYCEVLAFLGTESLPSRAKDVADSMSLDKRVQVNAESFSTVCIGVSSG